MADTNVPRKIEQKRDVYSPRQERERVASAARLSKIWPGGTRASAFYYALFLAREPFNAFVFQTSITIDFYARTFCSFYALATGEPSCSSPFAALIGADFRGEDDRRRREITVDDVLSSLDGLISFLFARHADERVRGRYRTDTPRTEMSPTGSIMCRSRSPLALVKRKRQTVEVGLHTIHLSQTKQYRSRNPKP